MRLKTHFLTLIICLFAGPPCLAQNASVEQLTKEMYRLYVTNKADSFDMVVNRLKDEALSVGDERTFYKAWANHAIYSTGHISRQRGLEIGNELREYAKLHDSKYGLYTASYATASMLSMLKDYKGAEQAYMECLDYLEHFIPSESPTTVYLGLAKIYNNLNRPRDVRTCAEHALADPGLSQMHRLTALGYMCLSYSLSDSTSVTAFNHWYDELQKVKQQVGHGGIFDDMVDFVHAKLNKRYDEALKLTVNMSPLDRLNKRHTLYSQMGRYRDAYFAIKAYHKLLDSINSADVRRQSSESAMQLEVARAEMEAKDLRLANQELELQQTAGELERQRLQADAAAMALKVQEAELQSAAMELENANIQLENATLETKAKELELREYHSQMELQTQSERSRRNILYLLIATAALVLALLAFFLWRRQLQMRKLKSVNEQLAKANSQLAETVSAKERIESELRIAREIQMSMVPSVFPKRPDLDIDAYMMPAKEVGGDLYSFVLLDEKLYFCIGDVSGKGVPASLFMAQTTRLFRSQAMLLQQPVDIANHLNHELAENNDQAMFVTMFIGLLHLDTCRLDFCNCGHNPPIINRQFLEMEPNAPIGLWPEMDFVGEHVDNMAGKRIFLYTDGLNEAEDGSQTQFGDKLIQDLLQSHPDYNSHQTIEVMRTAVEEHVANAESSDDLTMMCIRVKS